MREGERSRDDEGTSIVAPGFRNWPRDEYEVHRLQAFARRRRQYPLRQEPGLFSLLTTVWNTPPEYLDALADSVLSQDADSTFEWVLLDNGSHDPGTRRSVERLARERAIRVFRVEDNLGIIGGMRFCLERAAHRYILPVDSDDLLTPDCLRVLSHALRQAGYPALAYTDEDNLEGSHFSSALFQARIRSGPLRELVLHGASWRHRPRAGAGARRLHRPAGRGQPRLGHVHSVPRRRPYTAAHPRSAVQLAYSPDVDLEETSIQSPSCTTLSAAS